MNDDTCQNTWSLNKSNYFWWDICVRIVENENFSYLGIVDSIFRFEENEIFINRIQENYPTPFLNIEQELNAIKILIENSQNYIYVEQQIIGCNVDVENMENTCPYMFYIRERIERAFMEYLEDNQKEFHLCILTNTNQPDESLLVQHFSKLLLDWPFSQLFSNISKFSEGKVWLREHVFIGHLQQQNTLIKIHSNFIVVDDEYLVRASTNWMDRSASFYAHDMELGVYICSLSQVSFFMRQIWKHHTLTDDIDDIVLFVLLANNETGLLKKYKQKKKKNQTSFFEQMHRSVPILRGKRSSLWSSS